MTRSQLRATLLFLSLGVNVFLIGFVFARSTQHPTPPRTNHHHQASPSALEGPTTAPAPRAANEKAHQPVGRGGPPEFQMLRELIRVMGGKDDPRVQKLWKQHRDESRASREALRTAQQSVKQALLEEPFKAQSLDAALKEVSRQSNESQKHAQEALVELATHLTPEERARLRKLRGPGPVRGRK